MIQVNIEKNLGDFHLKVQFETENTLALLGASGCGKSMTLKCIAGLMTPDKGTIIINNRVLFDSEKKINVKPQDRHVGYMAQSYALFPNMSVLQNITSSIQKQKDKMDIAHKIMKQMHLEGYDNRKVTELSGGQKQRVALARMLVSSPDIILLDEPLSALDIYLKRELLNTLHQTLQEYNKQVIIVTHDLKEAYKLGNELAIINEGRVERMDSKNKVIQKPEYKQTAILLGYNTFLPYNPIDESTIYLTDMDMELKVNSYRDSDLIAIRDIDFDIQEMENRKEIQIVHYEEDVDSILVYFTYKQNHRELTLHVSKDVDVSSITHVGIRKEHIAFIKD